MKTNYPIKTALNFTLFVGLLLLNAYLLFVLPLLMHHLSAWWALSVFVVLFFTNTTWALIHEGIHRNLLPGKLTNHRLSRLLSVVFGCAFDILRFGHLMHHRFSRTSYDQPEVYFPEKDVFWKKQLGYFSWLCGGLYFTELFGPIASYLPRKTLLKIADKLIASDPTVRDVLKQQLLTPRLLKIIRVDTTFILLFYILSFCLYGKFWWLLALALVVRGLLASAADNLPHYGTPLNQSHYAYNLQVKPWLRVLLLNFNFHRVHHQNPQVPWAWLPAVYQEKDKVLDKSYLRQWVAQFRGIINVKNIPE